LSEAWGGCVGTDRKQQQTPDWVTWALRIFLGLGILVVVSFIIFVIFLNIAFRDFPSNYPSPELAAQWERAAREECRRIMDGGRVVDIPTSLAEEIIAGMRGEISAMWAHPDSPGLVSVRDPYVGRGPGPESAWMVRLDADEHVVKVGFLVTEENGHVHPRGAFVLVRGPPVDPEDIRWIDLGPTRAMRNPTLFKAEIREDWQIPPEYNCLTEDR